ncbi:MAG: hypothetical protein R6V56_09015 [Lentisphaeria bacterium]
MPVQLSWEIIVTGSIAHVFARGLQTCKYGRLQAVASRTQEKGAPK